MNIRKLLLLIPFFGFAWSNLAMGQGGIVRGSIVDDEGEALPGATVMITKLNIGANTNEDGIFSISKVPAGTYRVRVTYIGMDTVYQDIQMDKGKTVSLALKMRTASTMMNTVEIVDQKLGKINKQDFDIGITRISPRQINLMPS